MTVVFTTTRGRTLRNDEMTAEDMTRALGSLVEVIGSDTMGARTFHVNTRHVVEWWDEPTRPVTMDEIVGVAL